MTVTLDTTALRCPLPVLKARKTLAALQRGERVELLADDAMAAIDVPHFCNEAGHRLVEANEADGVLRFVIEKG